MRRPRCNCGAIGANSHIHTEQCDVMIFERQEQVFARTYATKDITTLKQFISHLVESQAQLTGLLSDTWFDSHVCQWAEYVGVTKRFEYCVICDRKRGGNA